MPKKHQLGKLILGPASRVKVIIKGGEWVDALQEAVEAHKGLDLVRVRTQPESVSTYKARPWTNEGIVTRIRRTFTFQ